jgi:hypothetical protein
MAASSLLASGGAVLQFPGERDRVWRRRITADLAILALVLGSIAECAARTTVAVGFGIAAVTLAAIVINNVL